MKIHVNDKLELKQVQVHEANDLYQLVDDNRMQLREWLPWLDFMTGADKYRPIITDWIHVNDAKEAMTLGVYYEGRLAGMCGYNSIDGLSRRGQIGYWLAEEFTGHGIMTEAVQATVDFGFKELGLNRVEIIAGVENDKSRKIAERLEFTQEAIMKDYEFLYDHYHDCALYRMLKTDWLT